MKSQFGTLPFLGAVWLTLASCTESHVGIETDGGPPDDSGSAVDSGTHSEGGAGPDGGTGDGAIDAQVDASKPGGSCQDAGSPLCEDASATCLPIDQSYKFFFDGGLSPTSYTSELMPDDAYQRVRRMGTSITTCNSRLSACGSTAGDGGVDRAELAAALSHADVVAAFAAASSDASTIYGVDSRPVDGQVFVVKRSDKQFAVGGPCNGTTGCREIPLGVSQLVTLLQRLDQEQNKSGPCAGF